MAPCTSFAPDARLTAGNVVIGIAPAIADITAPTLAELNASTAIQCSTEAFGSTTSVTKNSRKMLCDTVAKENVAKRQYGVDDLTIMVGDPQDAATTTFLGLFPLDTVKYLWIRPGKDDTVALDVADKVQVIAAKVDSVDLRTVSNADGDEFAIVVKFSVQDRTQLFGTVAHLTLTQVPAAPASLVAGGGRTYRRGRRRGHHHGTGHPTHQRTHLPGQAVGTIPRMHGRTCATSCACRTGCTGQGRS